MQRTPPLKNPGEAATLLLFCRWSQRGTGLARTPLALAHTAVYYGHTPQYQTANITAGRQPSETNEGAEGQGVLLLLVRRALLTLVRAVGRPPAACV